MTRHRRHDVVTTQPCTQAGTHVRGMWVCRCRWPVLVPARNPRTTGTTRCRRLGRCRLYPQSSSPTPHPHPCLCSLPLLPPACGSDHIACTIVRVVQSLLHAALVSAVTHATPMPIHAQPRHFPLFNIEDSDTVVTVARHNGPLNDKFKEGMLTRLTKVVIQLYYFHHCLHILQYKS
jgi:hypothetical protein